MAVGMTSILAYFVLFGFVRSQDFASNPDPLHPTFNFSSEELQPASISSADGIMARLSKKNLDPKRLSQSKGLGTQVNKIALANSTPPTPPGVVLPTISTVSKSRPIIPPKSLDSALKKAFSSMSARNAPKPGGKDVVTISDKARVVYTAGHTEGVKGVGRPGGNSSGPKESPEKVVGSKSDESHSYESLIASIKGTEDRKFAKTFSEEVIEAKKTPAETLTGGNMSAFAKTEEIGAVRKIPTKSTSSEVSNKSKVAKPMTPNTPLTKTKKTGRSEPLSTSERTSAITVGATPIGVTSGSVTSKQVDVPVTGGKPLAANATVSVITGALTDKPVAINVTARVESPAADEYGDLAKSLSELALSLDSDKINAESSRLLNEKAVKSSSIEKANKTKLKGSQAVPYSRAFNKSESNFPAENNSSNPKIARGTTLKASINMDAPALNSTLLKANNSLTLKSKTAREASSDALGQNSTLLKQTDSQTSKPNNTLTYQLKTTVMDERKSTLWRHTSTTSEEPKKLESVRSEQKQSQPLGSKSLHLKSKSTPSESKSTLSESESTPSGSKYSESKPSESKSPVPDPSESDPSESKPSESKPSESKPSGSKYPLSDASESKPSESKPSGSKPSESKPSESKPSESKPSGSKSPVSDPSESKPSESKPSEFKPSESKPSESKPSESKPSESKSKPSESKSKPSESKSKPSESESESEPSEFESNYKPSESKNKPSEPKYKPSESKYKPSKSKFTASVPVQTESTESAPTKTPWPPTKVPKNITQSNFKPTVSVKSKPESTSSSESKKTLSEPETNITLSEPKTNITLPELKTKTTISEPKKTFSANKTTISKPKTTPWKPKSPLSVPEISAMIPSNKVETVPQTATSEPKTNPSKPKSTPSVSEASPVTPSNEEESVSETASWKGYLDGETNVAKPKQPLENTGKDDTVSSSKWVPKSKPKEETVSPPKAKLKEPVSSVGREKINKEDSSTSKESEIEPSDSQFGGNTKDGPLYTKKVPVTSSTINRRTTNWKPVRNAAKRSAKFKSMFAMVVFLAILAGVCSYFYYQSTTTFSIEEATGPAGEVRMADRGARHRRKNRGKDN